MKTLFTNTKLILPDRVQDGWLIAEDGLITETGTGVCPKADYVIDCGGNYLSPGFVELHTHGAGGADFMDGTAEAFETACLMHLSHGTTSILPTGLAASGTDIIRLIENFREAKELLKGRGPRLPGLHMEGPYLCKEQCGAIDPEYIRPPVAKEYENFLSRGKGCIRRWTLAIEPEGALQFVKRLHEEGILPSIGHSNAEYSQVLEGFEAGMTHVTHLYSAMSTITRKGGFRHSGVLESAFCIPDMTVELIADGCHVPPELLEMVYHVKGPDKTCLVCDSMRCAGQNVTESVFGTLGKGQAVIIEDGVAKMPDRTCFAGSIALDDRLVRTMTQLAHVPLHDAVKMITLTPARIIGMEKEIGSLEKGKRADMVIFDDEINVKAVFVDGVKLVG
ncbi:MAG: N-acetylglucosamine-6-phosphate deacetylase [Clostridia bacterium]|nr:N-acetylglucosamine-6-phosphate deacetylase [Clostridia bacterium]